MRSTRRHDTAGLNGPHASCVRACMCVSVCERVEAGDGELNAESRDPAEGLSFPFTASNISAFLEWGHNHTPVNSLHPRLFFTNTHTHTPKRRLKYQKRTSSHIQRIVMKCRSHVKNSAADVLNTMWPWSFQSGSHEEKEKTESLNPQNCQLLQEAFNNLSPKNLEGLCTRAPKSCCSSQR